MLGKHHLYQLFAAQWSHILLSHRDSILPNLPFFEEGVSRYMIIIEQMFS
jgi:hypothetical protein